MNFLVLHLSSSSLSESYRLCIELSFFISDEDNLEFYIIFVSFFVLTTRTMMMTMKMRKTVTLMKINLIAVLEMKYIGFGSWGRSTY